MCFLAFFAALTDGRIVRAVCGQTNVTTFGNRPGAIATSQVP